MSKEIDRSLILNKLKSHYGFNSDTDFSKFLGIKPQTLSSWHSRNSFDIDLIYSKCVNVNGDFLLSGTGEIEKTKSLKNVVEKNDHNNDHKNDHKPNVKKRYAIESPEMPLVTEENTVYKGNAGIPLIPIDAMAGFGTGAVQVMHYDTSKYIVPEFSELNVDFMIRVKGSSMVPKYNSGDLVACKKLVITDIFFQWNKVYVLDTEQGALIKRVKKGSRDNYILLISDNKNYDPFELHLSKIFAVALVVGVIRLE